MTDSASVDLAANHANIRKLLIAVIVIGCIARIIWAIYVPVVPVSDSHAYDTFARNIATHGTYGWEPDVSGAYWAIGYPGMIGVLYSVFGIDYAPVVAFNTLISFVFIGFAGLLGYVWFNRSVGLVAAAIVSIWPSFIMQTTVLASEVLFATLLTGSLILFFWFKERPVLRWLLLGLSLGIACYVRPVALLIPIVLAISEAVVTRSNPFKLILGASVSILVMLAVLSPWSYRNYTVFDKFVLVSTNFGANFWMGNNPDTQGTYQPLPDWARTSDEIKRDTLLKEAAIQYIKDEPVAFAIRTFQKFFKLHAGETIFVHWNAVGIKQAFGDWANLPFRLVSTGYWFLCLGAGLFGIFILLRQGHFLIALFHPAILIWGYFASVHAVIVVQDRYHFPSIPSITVLGAVAILYLLTRFTNRDSRTPPSV